MNQCFTENKNLIKKTIYLILALILLGVIFLAALTFNTIKQYNYIGRDISAANTITVSGNGEVLAKPDIATFSFSITKEAANVSDAQNQVTSKTNDVLKAVKGAGINDNDLKTTGYNIYPKYTYGQSSCTGYNCPPANQKITGYTVSQTIEVKVRDLSKINDVVAQLGSLQVDNLNGPNLSIDDDSSVMAQARAKAIADARKKAQYIANDLGVKLGRVVGFSESTGGVRVFREMSMTADSTGSAPAPQLPTGQNNITSNVSVTYEI